MFSAYIKEAEPLEAEEESKGGDELTGKGLDSRKCSITHEGDYSLQYLMI